MSKRRGLSQELRDVAVWLERQPGVINVVQGHKYVRVRHHHQAGFARVRISDDKSVHVVAYDKLGCKDFFIYAPPSPLRDRWVAALTTGTVIGANGNAPELKPVKETIKTVISRGAGSDKHVPKPEAALIHENAGQVYSVSPDLAAKWLEHNTRNRKLRQSVVNKYAADMREGRWLLTGDAIAFDKNGCGLYWRAESPSRCW
jgi:hypothetical protein